MNGKICLITGANSGIGKFTALELAKLGSHVVMICRNYERGVKAQKEIIEQSKNPDIDLYIVDLASQSAIKNFAEDFKKKYDMLHILINNAGTITKTWTATEDGIERTFAVNHLGPFLITNLLLDFLNAGAPSRIITITSGMHSKDPISIDSIQSQENYSNLKAYSISKLANILFTYELSNRLLNSGIKTVTANVVHPGFTRTNFGKEGLSFLQKLGLTLIHPFMAVSLQKGAETPIFLAISPDVEGITGKYYVNKKIEQSAPNTYDQENQNLLWKISEKLTAIKTI